MDMKAWIKEFVGVSAFGAVWILLTLLFRLPIFVSIIPFVIIDCIIGYIYKNRILANKAYLKIQSQIESRYFNSEYYDLYYEFNFSRILVIAKSLVLTLVVNSILGQSIEDYINYITIGIILMFVVMVVVSFVLFSRKKEHIIMRLINLRKENWFGEYTQEETEILMKLGKNVHEKVGNQ